MCVYVYFLKIIWYRTNIEQLKWLQIELSMRIIDLKPRTQLKPLRNWTLNRERWRLPCIHTYAWTSEQVCTRAGATAPIYTHDLIIIRGRLYNHTSLHILAQRKYSTNRISYVAQWSRDFCYPTVPGLDRFISKSAAHPPDLLRSICIYACMCCKLYTRMHIYVGK